MKVGIVGLGLIGGSLAKAIRANSAHRTFVYDSDPIVMKEAELLGLNEKTFQGDVVSECDIVVIALYPEAANNFLRDNANMFKKDAIVTDCVGIKCDICGLGFALAKQHGFIFIGGHPMAGTQFTGFAHSRTTLFKNASAILTPPGRDIAGGEDAAKVEHALKILKRIYTDIGCTTITVTTPQEHDKLIAYTSQLPHVISNSYVKNTAGRSRKGFFGGSYKDMSRTAKIAEDLWVQLYLRNTDNLVSEIDEFMQHLTEFRAALAAGDDAELKELIRVGREKYNISD